MRCFLIAVLLSLLVFSFVQTVVAEDNEVTVEFFYAEGCSHCEEKKPVIDEIEQYYGDNITVQRLIIAYSENKRMFFDYGFTTTPGAVVKNSSTANYSVFPYELITVENLKNAIDYYLAGNYTEAPPKPDEDTCIETPFGTFCFNTSEISLPVITVIIGALDSINPCAFLIA